MSVIPSLDGAVLGALAGTTAPLNLSTVHRLAQTGSLSGVRLVLVRLTSTGLVHEVPGGYELNRDHVAADPVLSLTRLWASVLERIRTEVATWTPHPRSWGCSDRPLDATATRHSDIDLLVVSDDDAKDRSARACPAGSSLDRQRHPRHHADPERPSPDEAGPRTDSHRVGPRPAVVSGARDALKAHADGEHVLERLHAGARSRSPATGRGFPRSGRLRAH